MYVTYNKYELSFSCCVSKTITLQTLVDSGDLKLDDSGTLINPVDGSTIPLTNTVSVTYNCNTKTFDYVVNNIDCVK